MAINSPLFFSLGFVDSGSSSNSLSHLSIALIQFIRLALLKTSRRASPLYSRVTSKQQGLLSLFQSSHFSITPLIYYCFLSPITAPSPTASPQVAMLANNTSNSLKQKSAPPPPIDTGVHHASLHRQSPSHTYTRSHQQDTSRRNSSSVVSQTHSYRHGFANRSAGAGSRSGSRSREIGARRGSHGQGKKYDKSKE